MHRILSKAADRPECPDFTPKLPVVCRVTLAMSFLSGALVSPIDMVALEELWLWEKY